MSYKDIVTMFITEGDIFISFIVISTCSWTNLWEQYSQL